MKSTKKLLKLQPFGKRIQIASVKPAGDFETNDSIKLQDKWKVVAIGDEVQKTKVGDVFFLKGYALEHVVDDDTGIMYSFTLECDDFLLSKICNPSSPA